MTRRAGHIPVLVDRTVQLLSPRPGGTMLDCTIGRGGHASRFILRLAPGGRYIGLDLDEDNAAYSAANLRKAADAAQVELIVQHADFRDARDVLRSQGIERVGLLLADLGFSSNQMSDPARGMSFSTDGPLDMRLDRTRPTTAAQLVNTLPQRELADVLYHFGEERLSRKIARIIIEQRAHAPIESTSELARLVRRAYGRRGSRQRIDPATRTFMALRIAVNAELDALDRLLEDLPHMLAAGGRAGIISFHSLEDRRVKQAFAKLERDGVVRRLTRKPVTAEDHEVADNPRCRSARLRVVEQLTDDTKT